ncbi:TetR/AcrR family transcriptional regulator [Streptomyces hyderabadensis]|uniref:TetR/AcrR family transcriptional regulator n=1 Tax=Streptomyces hyderabadensis TaxID=598549 RepID=A0ABP9IPK3_9ACTN|nr:TetR/AcrR family transcriptional regulator [Streptomyces hyderabadensis]
MVKQARALKTRDALVRAASAQFCRHGYAGTSLTQIRDAARISMGALTFHFSTKAELADAVEKAAQDMTTALVERVSSDREPSLALAVELTLELTRLLAEQDVVRAAARLARERPGSREWSSTWQPEVRRIIEESHREGCLPQSASPQWVATLAVRLIDGMDASLHRSETTTAQGASAAAELSRLWQLILVDLKGSPSAREPLPDRGGLA